MHSAGSELVTLVSRSAGPKDPKAKTVTGSLAVALVCRGRWEVVGVDTAIYVDG